MSVRGETAHALVIGGNPNALFRVDEHVRYLLVIFEGHAVDASGVQVDGVYALPTAATEQVIRTRHGQADNVESGLVVQLIHHVRGICRPVVDIDTVVATQQQAVSPEAGRTGDAGASLCIAQRDETVVPVAVARHAHVGQYPQAVVRVFQDLVNVVARQGSRVVRVVQVTFQFVPVEASQAEFCTCPNKAAVVGRDTVQGSGQSFVQLDLLIYIMCGVQGNR